MQRFSGVIATVIPAEMARLGDGRSCPAHQYSIGRQRWREAALMNMQQYTRAGLCSQTRKSCHLDKQQQKQPATNTQLCIIRPWPILQSDCALHHHSAWPLSHQEPGCTAAAAILKHQTILLPATACRALRRLLCASLVFAAADGRCCGSGPGPSSLPNSCGLQRLHEVVRHVLHSFACFETVTATLMRMMAVLTVHTAAQASTLPRLLSNQQPVHMKA